MAIQEQIQASDVATAESGEAAKPTVVLVHGAVEDASIWHEVVPRLQRAGYPVICFANPLRSLGVDTAYLRSVLDGIEGPVILVSHASWRGGHHPGRGPPQGQGPLSTRPPQCQRWGNRPMIASNVSGRRLRLVRQSDDIHSARRNQRHLCPGQGGQVPRPSRRRRA